MAMAILEEAEHDDDAKLEAAADDLREPTKHRASMMRVRNPDKRTRDDQVGCARHAGHEDDASHVGCAKVNVKAYNIIDKTKFDSIFPNR